MDIGPRQQVPKLSLLDRDCTIVGVYGDVYMAVMRHSVRSAQIDNTGAQVALYRLSRLENSRLSV